MFCHHYCGQDIIEAVKGIVSSPLLETLAITVLHAYKLTSTLKNHLCANDGLSIWQATLAIFIGGRIARSSPQFMEFNSAPSCLLVQCCSVRLNPNNAVAFVSFPNSLVACVALKVLNQTFECLKGFLFNRLTHTYYTYTYGSYLNNSLPEEAVHTKTYTFFFERRKENMFLTKSVIGFKKE